jgi:hypothetical protein
MDVSIALTAAVHLLNNLFKLGLLWKDARRDVVMRFGIPAMAAAFAGAKALFILEKLPPLLTYQCLGREISVLPGKFIIAALIIIFVLLEFFPRFKRLSVAPKYLPLGGALSGFLGGLSGHQGALRGAFLIKCGLSKESFIASGVVIACLVDVSRIAVYAEYLRQARLEQHAQLLLAAALASFSGVFIGARLVKNITVGFIQKVVSVMLVFIAFLLGAGFI